MRLHIIQPDVSPQHTTYSTTNGSITIHVGFTFDSLNSVVANEDRHYTLSDASGNVIQEGIFPVVLNTFMSSITFDNLVSNVFYTFSIYNTISGNINSCSIITGTISGVIDDSTPIPKGTSLQLSEHLRLKNGRIVFGDTSTFTSIGKCLAPGMYVGNALAIVNGSLYAYKPTMLVTNDTTMPSSISYVPLPGMASYTVRVHQLAKITKVGRGQYSIVPHSTLDLTVGDQVFSYKMPVGFVDVSTTGLVGSVVILTQTFLGI
jgi:hypothetical protein